MDVEPSFTTAHGGNKKKASAVQVDEYTDEQFQKDLEKAKVPISKMAERARTNMKAGKGRKFPE